MGRPVRRLVLLGVVVGGLWVLRRVAVERAGRSAWRPPGQPQLGPGRQAPALPAAPPIRDLDAFRAARAVTARVAGDVDAPTAMPTAVEPERAPPAGAGPGPDDPAPPVTPGPDASPPTGPQPGNLDKVRERLASIHVDEPPARSGAGGADGGATVRSRRPRRPERWQEPAGDGSCDPSHPIKVKVRSGLFHLPGMFAYERTRADRCYRSAADAEADGFARARR